MRGVAAASGGDCWLLEEMGVNHLMTDSTGRGGGEGGGRGGEGEGETEIWKIEGLGGKRTDRKDEGICRKG